MNKILLTIAVFFALATCAFADNYYAAIDYGQVSYKLSNMQFINTVGTPAPDFSKPQSWRINGGYRFNPYWGVEAGYSSIGDSTVNFNTPGGPTSMTLKGSAFQIVAVGTYSFNDRFAVFGRLGAVNTKLDISLSAPGNIGSGSASKTNLVLGLGAQYNINQQFSIRVMYEDLGKTRMTLASTIGGSVIADYSVKITSLGVVYNF